MADITIKAKRLRKRLIQFRKGKWNLIPKKAINQEKRCLLFVVPSGSLSACTAVRGLIYQPSLEEGCLWPQDDVTRRGAHDLNRLHWVQPSFLVPVHIILVTVWPPTKIMTASQLWGLNCKCHPWWFRCQNSWFSDCDPTLLLYFQACKDTSWFPIFVLLMVLYSSCHIESSLLLE